MLHVSSHFQTPPPSALTRTLEQKSAGGTIVQVAIPAPTHYSVSPPATRVERLREESYEVM